MTPMLTPAETVEAWHIALASGDLAALSAVTHPDVELAGPRGATSGRPAVLEWATHSGIRLEIQRRFARGPQVVVEQRGQWRDPQTGTWTAPVMLATVFTVENGRVMRIARHPDLDNALADAGLSDEDIVGHPD